MAEQDVPETAAQIEQVRQAVLQLQRIVGYLAARPPVHMSVAHMAVEHLAFNVAGIDVEELSGQLNLGMTHLLQVARPAEGSTAEPPKEPVATAPTATCPEPPGEQPEEPSASPLWPPESGEDEQR